MGLFGKKTVNLADGGFLVTADKASDKKDHLPTERNGKPNRALAAAAWAALFSAGGDRGKKYDGPNRAEAQKALKALYKDQKWPEPGSSEANAVTGMIFVDMSIGGASVSEARPHDGLAPGTFISMSGKRVTFDVTDFPSYIAHTQAVLESTRDSSGNIVGLPIDQDGHDHKGGAGWLVGVELDPARNVIRFLTRWTQIGVDLISGNIRRYFSPSVDPDQKVILGGSLTNSPASRDAQHKMLLRPVELSAGVQAFAISDSLGSIVMGVCDEFNEEFGCPVGIVGMDEDAYFRVFGWPQSPEVYPGYLVAVSYDGDDLYKVTYEIDASTDLVTFQPRSEWTGLKIEYKEQPNMADQSNDIIKGIENIFTRWLGQPKTATADLTATQTTTTPPPPAADVTNLLTPGVAAELERRANERANELIMIAERRTRVQDFSAKLVGGEAGSGYGVAMPQKKVAEILLNLPDADQDAVMGLLNATLKGVVDFRERGHGHDFADKKEPVPVQYAGLLKQWVKDGNAVADFFAINPEIGEASTFDLSAYEGGK